MCGHGLIGVVASLAKLGRIEIGEVRFETPVGIVSAELFDNGDVAITNVASYREQKGIILDLPGHGKVSGDIAWGGNWFFITEDHGQTLQLACVESLTAFTWSIRQELDRIGIDKVDHIILQGSPQSANEDARDFVLCPGKAYDRSPCGTGTSAIVACLADDDRLKDGMVWRQAGILGTVFEGSYLWEDRELKRIRPTIRGRAYITSRCMLEFDPADPFCLGIVHG